MYSSYVPSTNYRAPSSIPHPHRSAPIDVDIDAETSALIAKLALEDLEESYQGRKGKGRANLPLTDEEVAYQAQVAHYQQMLIAAEDSILAKSIAGAVNTDEAYLNAFIIAEEAAAQDRRAAEMLSRNDRLPERTAAQVRVEQPTFVMHPDPPPVVVISDDEDEDDISDDDSDHGSDNISNTSTNSDLDSMYEEFDRNLRNRSPFAPLVSGRPSSVANGKRPAFAQPKIQNADCTICTDHVRINKALHTPCNHYYCKDCVVALVEAFTRDESLFPLRCCGEPIPKDDVVPFLDRPLTRLFNEKHTEFSVSSQHRVYCVSPQCSKFLGSSEGVRRPGMVCPSCFTSTCPKCKQAAHEGEGCGENTSAVALRALASENGWQTCPGCNAVVELSLGCFHMTCRCRTQFCYLCAVPWKECACPQWEESRLLATAQQRVENELGPRAIQRTAPSIVRRQFEELVANLRVNHECERHAWRYRDGGGRCESCNFNLPQFLLLCRHCAMLACVRCTRNRL